MRHRLRGQKGAEILEYALVLPVLFTLALGIMDFGLVFFSYETLRTRCEKVLGSGLSIPPTWAESPLQSEASARGWTRANCPLASATQAAI